MAKKDEELQDLVRGGSANPYGDGSTDAFIKRRGALQANVDDAKESRKVAWRKSMEKKGYEVDGSDNAYTTSGKFVQSFEGSEKGEALQNQIRKIDWDKEQDQVPQKDPEKGRYSSDVKERTQSFMARMADGHEPTDDEWEGYLRDIEGIYGGVRMPTGEDTTDEDLQEYPETIQGDDGVYTASVEKAQLKQKHKKEETELNNQQYLKEVSWDGMNRTYTSNYREAVKNAAGWARFYGEADESGNPIERSDVFTIDPATGMPVGVMSRSQRRNWDMQRHQNKIKSTLTEAETVAMEETGRTASETKAIHSEKGLETVIGGEPDKTGTQLGTGLKNIGDASNPEISFKPSDDDEDD